MIADPDPLSPQPGGVFLKISVLSSGSGGNSLYIETPTHRILIDAGLSAKKLGERMAVLGRSPGDLDAVFLTHEHSDHVGGVGPLLRKHNLTLHSTAGTLRKIQKKAGRIPRFRAIRADEPVQIGDLCVEPYRTPHDAEEPVAFVVRHGELKLGHATDLGSATAAVREKLKHADVLLLEANHDVGLLQQGPYPWSLKQRILSDVGHLSNQDSGELLAAVAHRGLKKVVLMHMSETNNRPEMAHAAAQQALGSHPAEIVFAQQDAPTDWIRVD